MVDKKMTVHSSHISDSPLEKSRVVLVTKERVPITMVTIESMDHEGMKEMLAINEIFVTVEDANVIRCTCISTREDLFDPKCPEHGE